MARLTINLGTEGNSATGDSVRGAFNKVNQNFAEIYNELGSSGILSDLSFAGNTISTDNTNQNIILSPNGTGLIDVDSRRIINVSDPTSAQDAATKNYVDTQLLSSSTHNITFVGDDSTGTAVTQGETFKFAGTQNITTAVSGDTLTITGPDLTNYLNSTQISVSGNKISTTESNANIELDPNGTGDVIVNSGDILPATDNTQYLGSASKRWHTVYVGPGSINLGGAVISNTGGVVALPGVNTVGYRPSEINGGAPGAPPSYPLADSLGTPFTFTDVPVIIDQVTYGLATGQIVLAPGVSYTRATYTATMSNPGVDGTVDNITITDPGSIYPANENFETINQDNMWALPAGTDLTDLSAINSAIQAAVAPYGVMSTGITSEARSVTNTTTLTDFSTITGTPTTLSGYGITDAFDGDFGSLTNTPTTLSGYGITDAISSGSTAVTIVGDDSTGTGLNIGETFKIAGTQNVTTAVSGDTLTITGPDLSSYATTAYVDAQNTAQAFTFVGDDSTGTAVNSGQTFKIAGTQNITTAVSGDTLTITGPDLSSYLTDNGLGDLTVIGSTIQSPSNADITLDPSGTGAIRLHSDVKMKPSTSITIGEAGEEVYRIWTQDLRVALNGTSNKYVDLSYENLNFNNQTYGGHISFENYAELNAAYLSGNRDTFGNHFIINVGTDKDFVLTSRKTASSAVEAIRVHSQDNRVNINDISISGTTIQTETTNSNLTLQSQGTGQVIVDSALKINKGYIEAINSLTSSSTITVDFSTASVHTVTLAENTQFVVTNLPTGGTGTIIITQDGGGSNTASFGTDGSTAVKFAGGTPTLSTAGNAIDVVTIFNDGTNYLGNIAKAYA